MKKLRTFIPASVLLFFATVASVHAASTPGGNPGGGTTPGGNPPVSPTPKATGLTNPLNGIDTLPQFLNAILAGVVQIGTIILILALVYTGFLFVAARGNAEEIQGARSALLWTVIGGLILLGASAIGLVIEGTVNGLRT